MTGRVVKFPQKHMKARCLACQTALKRHEYLLCKSCFSYERMYRDAMTGGRDEEANR